MPERVSASRAKLYFSHSKLSFRGSELQLCDPQLQLRGIMMPFASSARFMLLARPHAGRLGVLIYGLAIADIPSRFNDRRTHYGRSRTQWLGPIRTSCRWVNHVTDTSIPSRLSPSPPGCAACGAVARPNPIRPTVGLVRGVGRRGYDFSPT